MAALSKLWSSKVGKLDVTLFLQIQSVLYIVIFFLHTSKNIVLFVDFMNMIMKNTEKGRACILDQYKNINRKNCNKKNLL